MSACVCMCVRCLRDRFVHFFLAFYSLSFTHVQFNSERRENDREQEKYQDLDQVFKHWTDEPFFWYKDFSLSLSTSLIVLYLVLAILFLLHTTHCWCSGKRSSETDFQLKNTPYISCIYCFICDEATKGEREKEREKKFDWLRVHTHESIVPFILRVEQFFSGVFSPSPSILQYYIELCRYD